MAVQHTTNAGEQTARGPVHIRLNLEDYLALPNDGKRYEILDGSLCVSPAPSVTHQKVVAQLLHMLMEWARVVGGLVLAAPTDVVLGPEDVVQPDVLWVSAARLGIVTEERIVGAPDLVIEVLSASTEHLDLGAKRVRYALADVRHYWLVYPKLQRLEALGLRDGGYESTHVVAPPIVLEHPEFPGLRIDTTQLFA